ncbi:DUF3592 domain-containing protein [Pseudomonas syringae]|nr:DUF3592 domain-containing protein [Pseudomonas syringae]
MKIISKIKYIFLAIGLPMLIGAVLSYHGTSSFLEDALSAEGTITDFEEHYNDGSVTYRPIVQFVDNNDQLIEFISSTGRGRSVYSLDEKVGVVYSPLNSQIASLDSFFSLWGATLITTILGVSFSSVSIFIFLIGRLRNRKNGYLQRDGVAVNARFQGVRLNHTLSVNGRNPYVIDCHWTNPETYRVHVFESDNIWFDPSSYINSEEIRVFMDKKNTRKYYVDTSFLPQLAK